MFIKRKQLLIPDGLQRGERVEGLECSCITDILLLIIRNASGTISPGRKDRTTLFGGLCLIKTASFTKPKFSLLQGDYRGPWGHTGCREC